MAVRSIDLSELGSLDAYVAPTIGSTGTISIQSSVVNESAFALRVNPTGTGTGYADVGALLGNGQNGSLGGADGYFSWDFRYATKPGSGSEPIAQVRVSTATIKATLRLTSTGTLDLYSTAGALVASGATVLAADTWYRIDLYVGKESSSTASDAPYILRINGSVEYSGTGDLHENSPSWIRLGKVSNVSGQSVDFFYDNVSISDTEFAPAGSRVRAMKPDGAGHYSGATAGTWQDVDELPHDSDTTYLGFTSNTNRHSVTLESAVSAGISGTIRAVQGYGFARDTGSTTVESRWFLRSGGTDSDASGRNPGNTYAHFGRPPMETDPTDSGTWTLSKLNALEVGCLLSASNATEQRVTALGVLVEFVPTGGGVGGGGGVHLGLGKRIRLGV